MIFNKQIASDAVQNFLQEQGSGDWGKLAFKKSPFELVSTAELLNQLKTRQKAKTKLPLWFGTRGVIYPPSLNLEQSSSQATAEFKAGLIPNGTRALDMTGGFGIDSFFLSQKFTTLDFCELDSVLIKYSRFNFEKLGRKNVKFINKSSVEYLKEIKDNFDLIFVDPSRRTQSKLKVFNLNECEPNLIENRDLILQKTEVLMIKNSPFLDISQSLNQLDTSAHVYIVAVKNEVKEVLLYIDKKQAKTKYTTVNISADSAESFSFLPEDLTKSPITKPKKFLYEPNAAIMKAGGFSAVAETFQVEKLHPNSNLFTADNLISFPGRKFEILKEIKLNKKDLKKSIPNFKVNITVRNYPMSVSEIRKKTKLQDGGEHYLFCTTNSENKPICLLCKKREL